ncbi:MAG: cyclic nucleotide-binding domain-containing protein [Bdellovibrionota bacterium]
MSIQVLVVILIFLAIVSFFGFVWQVYSLRGIKAREKSKLKQSGSDYNKRKSDQRKLTKVDQRIFNQAQDYLKRGRPGQAAQLLESIHMQREAISILENAGMIHEAAKILMRMGKHNRAGVIYARHAYWDRAAECYKMAEMPLEVGKCAKEAGNLPMAAKYLAMAERFGDAARVFAEMGEDREAAKYFLEALEYDMAVEKYKALLAKDSLDALSVTQKEVKIMSDWIKNGSFDKDIARIVVKYTEVVKLILAIAEQGRTEHGAELVKISGEVVCAKLLNEVNYEDSQMWEGLAKIFILGGYFSSAGIIFENKSLFERAAVAFEKAGNSERSIYCYKRAGVNPPENVFQSTKRKSDNRISIESNSQEDANMFSLHSLTNFKGDDDSGRHFITSREPSSHNTPVVEGSTELLEASLPPLPMDAAAETSSEGSESDYQPISSISSNLEELPEATNLNLSGEPSLGFTDYNDSSEADYEIDKLSPPEVPESSTGLSIVSDLPSDHEVPLFDKDSNDFGEGMAASEHSSLLGPLDFESPEVNKVGQSAYKVEVSDVDTEDNESILDRVVPEESERQEDREYLQEKERVVVLENPGELVEDVDDKAIMVPGAFDEATFLGDLSARQRYKLWSVGFTKFFPAEEAILGYNDEPLGIYVILSGAVQCFKVINGVEQSLDIMYAGETFGELWLLSGHPTAVRFVAETDSEIRVIAREQFNELLDRDGAIARKVYKRFTVRLLNRLLNPQSSSSSKQAS